MSYDIWRCEEPLAKQAYNLDNYKIIQKKEYGICVIYCSSNDIWYPNEKEVFIKKILQENRFEWENIRYIDAAKEIFIRDIYKSWYVTGINSRIDSMDKLLAWLRKETEGYNIIVVGSSAGGYLASIISLNLKISHAIVFSPQFYLNNKYAFDVNPFLQRYEKDRGNYYRCNFLEKKEQESPIYYFYPAGSKSDAIQYEYVRDVSNVKIFKFKSSRHGIPCFKCDLTKIINMPQDDLDLLWRRLYARTISPLLFSIKISGLKIAIKYVLKNIPRVINKLCEKFFCKKER